MRKRLALATILILFCATSAAIAQDKQPSADQKAAMDAMMKAMTPGDAHKLLGAMVGTFDAKVSMWQAPGAKPSVDTASAESKWVLGNRYIEQRFTGTFMGMPFSGIGYTGYDNVKKQYWSTWIDNMSTGIMTSTGATTDSGKTWKFNGTMADPMTGKDSSYESRLTVTDADHHVMEMYGAGPDGKVFKMMEIAYSRKK